MPSTSADISDQAKERLFQLLRAGTRPRQACEIVSEEFDLPESLRNWRSAPNGRPALTWVRVCHWARAEDLFRRDLDAATDASPLARDTTFKHGPGNQRKKHCYCSTCRAKVAANRRGDYDYGPKRDRREMAS